MRDGGAPPDQKSAASVPAQGGNEGTDAADSLAMGDKRRGRDRKGAIDARHLRGGISAAASQNIGSAVCLFFFREAIRSYQICVWRTVAIFRQKKSKSHFESHVDPLITISSHHIMGVAPVTHPHFELCYV